MEVHYVHGIDLDTNDPILRKILEYCLNVNIPLRMRSYDQYLYDEDKEYIARLPALQIYVRNDYDGTIYPDFKPIQFLQQTYDKFQLEEMEREAKRQIWEERIRFLKRMFYSSKTDFKRPR